MGSDSKIQWTHHTFNPWWGCEKVSPACKHCYAEAFAKRTGHAVWGGDGSSRRFFGDKHWEEPLKWNRAAEKAGERHRVFCASMADVFEARDDLDPHRARLWELIEATPHLDWLLLTKRPEEIMDRIPERWRAKLLAHVWCGTTVENQEMADARIPHLLRVPARVRFLSMEPLLEHVDIRRFLRERRREGVLGAGGVGVVHGPGGRDDLATRGIPRRRERCAIGRVPGDTAASGEKFFGGGRVSEGPLLGLRGEAQGCCAPDRLDGHDAPLDSSGHGDQPRRRGEVQQQPGQPGACDAFGERAPRDPRTRPEAQSSAGRVERAGEADRGAGDGDPDTRRVEGDDAERDRGAVRHRTDERLGDLAAEELGTPGVGWVIIGGESGPRARQFDLAAARDLLRQCREAGTAAFVKQLGARPETDDDDDRRHVGDMMIQGRFRMRLWDRSGGEPSEWPEDLQVRQFPEVTP